MITVTSLHEVHQAATEGSVRTDEFQDRHLNLQKFRGYSEFIDEVAYDA
jgi:hypothetical protein